jgi:tetratricopeptide (TPR) repeat protein
MYHMLQNLMTCCSLIGLLAVSASSSTNAETSLDRAIRLFNTKHYQESRPLLEEVVRAHPDNATAHYYLGRIYLHDGDYNQAISNCKTSVDIRPDVAAHHFCLGRGYGEKARQAPFWMQALLAPKIRQAFETVITLDPGHREARVGLTHFYMRAPGIMGGSLIKAQEQAEQLMQLKDPRGEPLLQDILKRQNKELSTN